MHCTMASRSVVIFSHACFGQSFLVAAVRSLSQAAQSVGLYESLPLCEMSARPPGSLQVKLFLRGSCFGANVRLLSSWRGPQTALKCSFCSDRVTRD